VASAAFRAVIVLVDGPVDFPVPRSVAADVAVAPDAHPAKAAVLGHSGSRIAECRKAGYAVPVDVYLLAAIALIDSAPFAPRASAAVAAAAYSAVASGSG
jgi:hypothetical protein